MKLLFYANNLTDLTNKVMSMELILTKHTLIGGYYYAGYFRVCCQTILINADSVFR